jgi:sugar phosphate permease
MNLGLRHHTIFYGWWVVAACSSIMLYTSGILHFGFTAYFEQIANEFHWGYAQVSFAASLRGVEMGLLGPVMGVLVDRWGPKRVIFYGGIVTAVGLLMLSRINSLAMFYAAFIVIAIGTSSSSHPVMMPAVSNWFRKRLGIAIGIMSSGAAMGGLMIPLVALMTDLFRWRTAIVIFAFGTLVIVLPIAFLVRNKPEQYGCLPDGEVDNPSLANDSKERRQRTEVSFQPKQALASREFWHIALAFACNGFLMNAVLTHVMPYLSSVGIPRMAASFVASALPVASIFGRLSFGWLGDRLNSKGVTVTAFALMGTGVVLFELVASMRWLLLPFIIIYGIGYGGNVPMRAVLLTEYFGRERFGTINGFLVGVMMLGNMTGAPLIGWAFDRWGTYKGAWLVSAAVTFGAVILMATTPKAGNKMRQASELKQAESSGNR